MADETLTFESANFAYSVRAALISNPARNRVHGSTGLGAVALLTPGRRYRGGGSGLMWADEACAPYLDPPNPHPL